MVSRVLFGFSCVMNGWEEGCVEKGVKKITFCLIMVLKEFVLF